jgi:C1A family cysteine protease
MNISEKGKGAIKNPLDLRDYKVDKILGAIQLPTEYSLRNKIDWIKDQGSSSSCVAQAFSYYAELLNFIETGSHTPLSARDIYSTIHLPYGNSYLRDGAKKVVNSGIVLEKDATSYEDGNPPSESFMYNRGDITEDEKNMGMQFLSKNYATWDNTDFETFEQAIYQRNGCVSGALGNNSCWQNAVLVVPKKTDWGHAIFFTGWKLINGIEHLEFVNSWGKDWGDNGFGYMPKSYVVKGLVFNPITLVDASNAYYSNARKTIIILQKLISLYQELINKIKVGINKFNKSKK